MQPSPFRPHPLLRNAHIQTVLSVMLRGPRLYAPTQIRAIDLGNGEQLAIHDSIPPEWTPDVPMVVIVHGMGGSARSAFVQRSARRFWQRGNRVIRVDLRGSGDGVAWSRRIYNAGVSGDIRRVLSVLHAENPVTPIWLAGFSLGGNIVLKLAGEAATEPVAGLQKVMAVAPPIDLTACSNLLSVRKNRFYQRHFARQLVRLARWHARHRPDVPLPQFPRRLSVRQFDELYTAPRGGYASAAEYYHNASSFSLIPGIQLPTLILTARDDPFIAIQPFEALTLPDNIQMVITPRGGHLGYLGSDGEGGYRWAEQKLVEWAQSGRLPTE